MIQGNELVVGKFNYHLVKILGMVLESSEKEYPLLIIQGSSGTGKTKTLKTIEEFIKRPCEIQLSWEIVKEKLALKTNLHSIKNISGIQLVQDFNLYCYEDNFSRLIKSLMDVDILLIDDLLSLKSNMGTQKLLEEVLKDRVRNHKQTIITISQRLRMVKGIKKSLKSILSEGLSVDLLEPDFEDRLLLVKRFCNSKLIYEKEIIQLISNLVFNASEVIGIVTKIEAYSKVLGERITIEFVNRILGAEFASTAMIK